MRNTFSKVSVSTVGKFDDAIKFPEWVRSHGGSFSRKVNSDTTHLIATEESYKNDAEAGMTNALVCSSLWIEPAI